MMLVKSRGLVAEAPRVAAAKPRRPAAKRTKAHRKAQAVATAAKRRNKPVRSARRKSAPPIRAAAPAMPRAPAAPGFADIRTEVCAHGEPPVRAMLARLIAPPEELESKAPALGAPLDTDVPGPAGGGLSPGPATPISPGGTGVTFLPPTTPPAPEGSTELVPPTVAPPTIVPPIVTVPGDGPLTPPTSQPPVVEPPFTQPPTTVTPDAGELPTGRPDPSGEGRPPTTLLPPLRPPEPPLEPRPPVAPVPEPGTWALLILGFGLLGARFRALRTARIRT